MTSESRQLGDLATQLVTESRRSSATDTLFKYNDPLVRMIIREQRGLEELVNASLRDTEEIDPSQVSPSAIIHQTAIARNKRCLLAYHHHRISFLKDLFWAKGGALSHILSNEEIRANLSPHEVDFLRSYNSLVVEFRSDFTDELDITASVSQPPKDIHALVRVVRDCGVIQTELGTIDFQKGQRFMVRKADVEHLITQGYLEEIQS
ncbi:GINS complex Psf1 component [Schizopora paradoxa]|uniref:DNA replication complex GINS protein PSF1 n=1 Tax=Schizopora paradoxa TaxID=27342 RepID=A0A0H2SPB3_9AGAM|nr:GINS complex Psf1 component [Schizopora paradoxa]